MMLLLLLFWVWCHEDLQVDASVPGKHTMSISSAEVAMLGSSGIYVDLYRVRGRED
jgi:hypothetical protein